MNQKVKVKAPHFYAVFVAAEEGATVVVEFLDSGRFTKGGWRNYVNGFVAPWSLSIPLDLDGLGEAITS